MNKIGRILGDGHSRRVTYCSMLVLNSTMVPPVALLFVNGSSLSKLSLEFKWDEYLPLNMDISWDSSQEYSCGSLRKMKSGFVSSTRLLRAYLDLEKPSIFQEREV